VLVHDRKLTQLGAAASWSGYNWGEAAEADTTLSSSRSGWNQACTHSGSNSWNGRNRETVWSGRARLVLAKDAIAYSAGASE